MMKVTKWAGRSIKMPGIYSDVPMETYHSARVCVEPSISSSGLRTIFLKSAAHYWCGSCYNPERIEQDETAALLFGRATHDLLFSREDFKNNYVEPPEMLGGKTWQYAGNARKEWIAIQEQAGKTVLRRGDLAKLVGMSKALTKEPLVRAGLLNGIIEHSWFWKDKETGIWLKSRPDTIPTESLDFADLKTTVSVDNRSISNTIVEFGYHQQAAMVAEGCMALVGKPITSFTMVFIEKTPPFCVAIKTLKDEDIRRGMKANRIALRKFADGLATGKWLGPAGETMDASYIELPGWAQEQLDERFKTEGV